MGYPIGSDKRGLARVTYESETVPWEFDIRAVPPGEDVLEVSDWHRRHGRANNRDGNIDRAAEALAETLSERAGRNDRGDARGR